MKDGPWRRNGRFVNLDPGEPKGWREVSRWRRERRSRGWKPTGRPAPQVPPDLARIRHPPGPQATWIGHATYLLQLDGRNVLTDPVWGSAGLADLPGAGVPRAVPPGIPWKDLPVIDLVLVSHNHYDHLDSATVRRLPRDTAIACPEGLGGWFRSKGFREVAELPWWETRRVAGFEVTSVPAQHWSRRGLFDLARSHWAGFVLEGERRVHFGGDSAWFSGFEEIGKRHAPAAALLPVGAYEPRWFMQSVHMTPEEAVEAARTLKARRVLPMHWGTFRLTDEPFDEPPARLRAAWTAAGLPPSNLAVPAVGETVPL